MLDLLLLVLSVLFVNFFFLSCTDFVSFKVQVANGVFCHYVQRLTLICDVRVVRIVLELLFCVSRSHDAFILMVLDGMAVVERFFFMPCQERLLDVLVSYRVLVLT